MLQKRVTKSIRHDRNELNLISPPSNDYDAESLNIPHIEGEGSCGRENNGERNQEKKSFKVLS